MFLWKLLKFLMLKKSNNSFHKNGGSPPFFSILKCLTILTGLIGIMPRFNAFKIFNAEGAGDAEDAEDAENAKNKIETFLLNRV